MSKSKKIKFTRRDRVCSIICAVFFLLCDVLMFYHVQQQLYKQDAINGGVIVEAKYVDVSVYTDSDTDEPPRYYLVYEYVDKNGVKYSDTSYWYKSDYEARSHLGEKIEIYIDGKGHSIIVGDKPDLGIYLTVAILLLLACLASIAMYIYQCFNKKTKEEEFEEKITDHELERIREREQMLEKIRQDRDEMSQRHQQLEIELELSRIEREVAAEQKAEKERLWKEYREALKECRNRGEDATFEEYLQYKEQQQKEKEIQE